MAQKSINVEDDVLIYLNTLQKNSGFNLSSWFNDKVREELFTKDYWEKEKDRINKQLDKRIELAKDEISTQTSPTKQKSSKICIYCGSANIYQINNNRICNDCKETWKELQKPHERKQS